MKCPNCGAANLVRETRDLPFEYKGERTTIRHVKGDYCPVCGEGVLTRTSGDAYGAEINRFIQEVNASLVEPSFIIRVRKKLKLGQREAGEIFGGGVNAFSRYETGKTQPPLALVKLLRLLDRHPELLKEVRAG